MKQLRKIFVALFLFSALLVKSQLHPHYLDGCINFIEYGFDTINNRWIPKGKFSFIQDKKGKLRKEYFKS